MNPSYFKTKIGKTLLTTLIFLRYPKHNSFISNYMYLYWLHFTHNLPKKPAITSEYRHQSIQAFMLGSCIVVVDIVWKILSSHHTPQLLPVVLILISHSGGAVYGAGLRKSTPCEVKVEDVAEDYRDIVQQNLEAYHTLRELRIMPLDEREWNLGSCQCGRGYVPRSCHSKILEFLASFFCQKMFVAIHNITESCA